MVSVAGFQSSAIQFDVGFVNYPTESKIEDKAGYTSGRGYLVVKKSLPWNVLVFSVRSNQDILPSSTLLCNYSHFSLQKTKMADTGLSCMCLCVCVLFSQTTGPVNLRFFCAHLLLYAQGPFSLKLPTQPAVHSLLSCELAHLEFTDSW